VISITKCVLPAALIGVIGVAGLAISPAVAVEMENYYKDKTVTILIPYGPGGTYDKYGQTFARNLDRHIPGNPNIIVQHMPGAGGAKAMNYAYTVMQKKGYHLVTPLDTAVVNQLMRPKKMRFKMQNFQWIGSSNQTNVIVVVRSDTGVKTVADMKNITVIGAASGKYSSSYLTPKLMFGLLGLKGRMVTGYKGSSRSTLAIEQGEAQMAAFNWLAWSSKVPHWFTGDKPFARAIVQTGVTPDPALPNVPMLNDLVSKENLPLVNFLSSAGPLGRGLTLPPGVPKDIVAGLRTAYDKMNADPKFAAELKKRKLRLIPTTGVKIQAFVSKVLKETSPEVIEQVRKIIFGGKS
jgi:tripartite-type tricarboxylate transporter receptor subunit TctC